MKDSKKIKAHLFRWERYIGGLAVAWTIVIIASLLWNMIHLRKITLEIAHLEAEIALEKDTMYRNWISRHSVVYVAVNEETPPNPYLSHIPERDITTPSGRRLTLMNPEYMTRQIYELTKKKYSTHIRTTSLNPLNPESSPDPWEAKALKAFERGEKEISSVEKIEQKNHMRLMRPLIIERKCLKCHAKQGYKEGDIRGGMSVSVPMEPLWAIERSQKKMYALVHFLLWLAGLTGIGLGMQKIRENERVRREAEESLQEAYAEVEQKVEERTAELRLINEALQKEITDRKRVEEEATKLQNAVQQIADILFITNQNGIIEYVNPAFEKITGYYREGAIGKTPRILKSGLMNAEYYKDVWSTILSGKVLRAAVINKKKDGELFIYDQAITPLRDPQGNITHFISTGRDITEQKRAEEELRQSQQAYEGLVNSIDGMVWEANAKTFQFLFMSKQAERILGYPHKLWIQEPTFWRDHIHPDDRDWAVSFCITATSEKRPHQFEYRMIAADGRTVWLRDNVSVVVEDDQPVKLQGIMVDITERKQLEEQFRQSQKMEAIGKLAGGIAHDFNNLLTVMKGYSQLSLLKLKESDPLRGNIEEIRRATDRASDLTRQLLAFSRRQVMEMRILDLNAILKDLDKMLRRLIGEDIELFTKLAEDLGRVKADSGQIEQVILNLAINARDAMPDGGKLIIETANVELDEAYARRHMAVKPGHYVRLSLSDTGVGMTPEVRERIFEPFFTTKERGKGTGLGLSTVYGIVKQSGGNIWVYSEPGKGTTFKIYLPRVDEPLDEVRKRVVEEELPCGSETVLVVEDEEEVRKVAARILNNHGYKVLEASQGFEAFLICEQHEGPIHLLLTDMVMPKMSGRELTERITTICPEIKVLYMSGYTDNAIVHHGVLEKGMNFVQKPFTMEDLVRKVREVLDR